MEIEGFETFLANPGLRKYLFIRLHTDTGLTGEWAKPPWNGRRKPSRPWHTSGSRGGSCANIRCRFIFSGKNDELTPDFPTPDFPE